MDKHFKYYNNTNEWNLIISKESTNMPPAMCAMHEVIDKLKAPLITDQFIFPTVQVETHT